MTRSETTSQSRRAPGRFVRTITLLSILAQVLAVPALYASHPDVSADSITVTADCPGHEHGSNQQVEPESCECSGGACCDGIFKRPPAPAVSGFEIFPGTFTRSALNTSPNSFLTAQTFSFTQSRGPPLA